MKSTTNRLLTGALALVLLAGSQACAATTVYTDLASYLAATAPGFYLEDFASIPFGDPGSPLSLGPVNGFSYDISAANGLFSGGGNMSTNTAFDPLIIDMTGSTVTSVGGNFWLTDFDFATELGTITIALADGSSTSESVVNATPSTFRGFVSDLPITQITLTPFDPGDGINRWSTVDNLYVGQMVPEPASISLILISLMGILSLRRG